MSEPPSMSIELPARLIEKPAPLTMMAVSAGILILLVGPGLLALRLCFAPAASTAERVIYGIATCIFLMLPIRIAFAAIQRKRRTGHWYPGEDERMRNRSKWGLSKSLPEGLQDAFLGLFLLSCVWFGVSRAIHHPTNDPANRVIALCLILFATSYLLKAARQRGLKS